MTKLRIPEAEYTGNQQYISSSGANIKYCWGHKTHRMAPGGKHLGPMKLFYCAECVSKRATSKGK